MHETKRTQIKYIAATLASCKYQNAGSKARANQRQISSVDLHLSVLVSFGLGRMIHVVCGRRARATRTSRHWEILRWRVADRAG